MQSRRSGPSRHNTSYGKIRVTGSRHMISKCDQFGARLLGPTIVSEGRNGRHRPKLKLFWLDSTILGSDSTGTSEIERAWAQVGRIHQAIAVRGHRTLLLLEYFRARSPQFC